MGHLQILYGNLAPEGSVAKIIGKEGLYFSGPAYVFEGEEAMIAAISEDPMSFKGKVVVIRGEGPKGGPSMPEMLTPTSAIMGAGLGKECALLTDGRFLGGSHGYVVRHIFPEAQKLSEEESATIDKICKEEANVYASFFRFFHTISLWLRLNLWMQVFSHYIFMEDILDSLAISVS
ncbi:dihydroxy-acid dehydratase, chloroplastic isoform X1 [Lactuca sativa]|uniref:dihydroxy-acid dehydratase, chloroplastic isoform X1 n=1 Tax=Lactuca sativa TaxID=4236 RepID=UPI000CD9C715|nr:dihydroxy-acid dehydratase, chloroplastic isoform X1 [Lactuca sativa]XP_023761799.1 dihydroxy-acid dehydratase, chloroplastic isoform X1 [Lactuca sativa]XP_023761800.1 dihydroxy-acid dehydratase, chloroplastic isoform X1 [Lactuca sativa]XP_042758850.1 dihydroxy-acid dehydratase, chloroplastic isoform X1 [Lactuca sativa]XP_042758851.1 dihydroxy-acid dehydratase, chloroplastic isoform X1 [Lactuca sativa]XP_042758852.1 dihydroxy-acid dehydratase, chloroplastic isoform X1 [Lactuca sativa]XP_04